MSYGPKQLFGEATPPRGYGKFLLSGYAFTKFDRLRKRSEFVHVSQHGKKAQNRHFLAFYCTGANRESRLGITVTKRVGKAVTRNRIKRSVREHFRLNRKQIQPYMDINVVAKKEAAGLTTGEMFHSLKNLFERIKKGGRH